MSQITRHDNPVPLRAEFLNTLKAHLKVRFCRISSYPHFAVEKLSRFSFPFERLEISNRDSDDNRIKSRGGSGSLGPN